MTTTMTGFSRRKEDNKGEAPATQLFFIFPWTHDQQSDHEVARPESMSLADFSQNVSQAFAVLINAVQAVSGRRLAKQQQFAEMLNALKGMEDVLDVTLSHVSETQLMAFNTLINASRCGFKAQTLVGVINEMTSVCRQSDKYLSGTRQSIADVKETIKNVQALVAATVENDMNLFTVIKTQVDHNMGRLSASEELLALIGSTQSYESTSNPAQPNPAQPKLCAKLHEDVANLTQVLATAERYITRLILRLSRDGVAISTIEQAQKQLAMLSRAQLIIKIS